MPTFPKKQTIASKAHRKAANKIPIPSPSGSSVSTSSSLTDSDSRVSTPSFLTGSPPRVRCSLPEPSTPVFNLTEDDLFEQEFTLAIAWKKNCLGAAYYNTQTFELFVVPDIPENTADHTILRSLYFQVKPKTLLVSTRQDTKRRKVIKTLVGMSEPGDNENEANFNEQASDEDDDDDSETDERNREEEELNFIFNRNPKSRNQACSLHFLPSGFFSLAGARRRLMALRLPGESPDCTDIEHYTYMKTVFPIHQPAAVQATGALLRVMERWGNRPGPLAEEIGPCKILSVRTETLDSLLWMDESTFSNLEIFAEDFHPSTAKLGQGNKEGLSLFGVANRCKSSLGTHELRLMFLRPTRDMKAIEERHKVIEFCSKPKNSHVVARLMNNLSKMKNVSKILPKVTLLRATAPEWKRLMQTLSRSSLVSQACNELPSDIKLFRDLANCVGTENFTSVAKQISDVIDFDGSNREGRLVAKPGVGAVLDELKGQYNGLAVLLEEVAEKEMENIPPIFSECKFVYFPEIGFLLGVPQNEIPIDQQTGKPIPVDGLIHECDKNDYAYFQTWRCQELNEIYGFLLPRVIDCETSLHLSVAESVFNQCSSIHGFLQLAGQLDALISLSSLNVDHRLTRPEFIEDEASISIEEGRHFLHQMIADNYVPNNTNLGVGDTPRILYLTGPNASGKSNYLKQVAMIVYMAHIGCYVPAKRARLPLVDRIVALTQTVESSSMPLSHFAIHLTAMSSALRSATRNSLIILDEFGKGTRDQDGMALLTSCIEYWTQKGDESPMILLSTHFHYVGELLKRREEQICFASMDYICHKEIIFLYQLVPGTCGASFPLNVARATGVPEEVLERAAQVVKARRTRGSLEPLESLKLQTMIPGLEKTLDDFQKLDAIDAEDIENFLLHHFVEEDF